jgi:uncharacterized repeat protein (TIGR01451 family)/gliding motility-associated-like protein
MIKMFTSKKSRKGKYFPKNYSDVDLPESKNIIANEAVTNTFGLEEIIFHHSATLRDGNLNHSNTKKGMATSSNNRNTGSKILNYMKSSLKTKGDFAKIAAFLIILFTFSSSTLLGQDIDLALRQSIDNSLPLVGEPIKYTIYLKNQSNNVATGISVNSQTPLGAISGVSTTAQSGITNYNSGNGIVTWTVPSLAGGDSLKLEILGTVGATGVFFNIAQVMAADQYDVDSDPANNKLYEDDNSTSCYSVPIEWFPADEYIVSIPAAFKNGSAIKWFKNGVEVTGSTVGASVNSVDSTLTIASIGTYTFKTSVSTCPSTGCCAIIIIKGDVFDLALKKTIIGNGPFTAPGIVTYNLEVINQGDITATFVNLVDYVPTGLTLLSNNWTMNVNGLMATYDQQLSILPKTSSNVQITFAINSDATGSIRNEAEISSAKGPDGIAVTDIDSYWDNIKGNDGTAINNIVDQNGKLVGDEDDHDFEVLTIQPRARIFDLALRKTVTNTGPYTVGQLVRYKIEVFNQGELDASFVKVADIVPPGLILTDINWSQNGDTLMYIPNISLAKNTSTSIYVSFKVAPNTPGGTIRNNAEIASAKGPSGEDVIDIDSNPDKNPLNDGPQSKDVIDENGKLGGDEDDSDYAEVIVINPRFDLAINKVVATAGPYSLGQKITYNIQIQNQGERDATKIKIADIVPAGLTLADNNWFMQSGNAVYKNLINLSVLQGIITIPISFIINDNFAGATIQNRVEITDAKGPVGEDVTDFDSTPNNNSTDEDDDDDEIIDLNTSNPMADLSVQKMVSNNITSVNDLISYTIKITNSGPSSATNVEVKDIIPAGLSYVNSAGGNSNVFAANTVTAKFNSIPSGSTVQFTISATVTATSGTIVNRVEVSKSDQLDPDSTPGSGADEDDDDTVSITVTSDCNPATPVISSNLNSICLGQSATLTATGCNGTVEWSNSQTEISIVVSPTNNTSYTATCKVSTCVSPESNVISIIVSNPTTPTIAASKSNICSGEEVTLTSTACGGTINWSNGMTGASINVTPTLTTTYSGTCKIGSCSSNVSNNVTVVVAASQVPTITSATSSVCSGSPVTLSVSNCSGNISWNNGSTTVGITVNPTATSTYSVTCGSGTCTGTAFKTITISVSQTPTITASKPEICSGESTVLTATNCTSGITWNTGSTDNSITVSPTATTTYTATCGIGACAASKTLTINVNTGQTPTITASKEFICGSGIVKLKVGNCSGNIAWSTGAPTDSITVSPTVTTTYTVLCGTGSCSGSVSKSITVGTAQSPTVTANKNSICTGESATLTAAGCFDGISWNSGQTSASITVSPTVTTTYSATCAGACGATGSKEITVIGSGSAPTITASTLTICESGSVTLTGTGCTGIVNWSNGMTGNSVNVNISANTTFTATCSNGTCTSGNSNTLAITIGTLQPPIISASGTKVCAGSAVSLTSSNCTGTVQWSSGQTGTSISVSPVVQTTYTAICKIGTCTSENSNAVMIEIIAALNAPVIGSSSARICQGESLTLNGLGCQGTVKWSTGQTGTNITISPALTTFYTATCMISSCESLISAPTTINVGNPFPPQISSQSTLICSGASTTINAEGCIGTVVWSTGQTGSVITVSPSVMMSYAAICKSSTCESEKSNVVTIGVTGNSIAAPTITSLTNTCPQKTVSLINGVTSTPKTPGGSFVFRTVNSPNSPTVSNSTEIASSGSFFVFENGGNGCYSVGSKIDVGIIACETNVDCITNPATSTAGKDTTICLKEDFFQLAGKIGGSALSATWTTSGTGTFSNATSPTAKYNYSLADVNSGTVVLTLKTNDPDVTGPCTAATTSFTLNINAVKTKPTISTSKSPIICLGDSVILTVNQTASAYLWSTGAKTKSIVVKTPGDYSVKLINENGCCSVSSDKQEVTNIGGIAGPTVNDLAKNICPSTTVDLKVNVLSTPTTNGGAFEYHTGITPSSPMLANVSAMPTGDYYVFEKTTLGCFSNPSLIKVIIDNCYVNASDAEVAIVITGNKTLVSIGDEVIYTIKVTNNGPKTATNVAIQNIIPIGIQIIGATPGLSDSGNSKIATIANLNLNETKTYIYTAKITKSGVVSNIAKIVALDQTDPIKSNNISQLDVECSTCQAVCIATSLKAKKERQSNGSYNIKFTSIVNNCGNVDLTGVDLKTNMAEMFGSTATFTMIEQTTVNTGSALTANVAYNGGTVTSILKNSSSVLSPSDIDTVMWAINLVPNGTEGPFSTNAIVSGVGLNIFNTASEVSDVSNDGLTILASSSTPTIIKLFKTPGIGLSLAIIDTVRQSNGSLNVTYQALVKNNGELALTNVIVSDTLSKTYVLPVTYTMVSAPTITGGLKPNPSFNGKTDVNLILPTSTMALGKLDTIRFVINVSPNTQTKFLNQAIAKGTGALDGGGTETVQDISNTGYNPDAPGDEPTELKLSTDDTQSVQTPCIGAALYISSNTKLADGSFDITYTVILRNCGNVNLTTIGLCDTLGADFSAPSVVTLKKKPSLGLGSTLALDANYNGTSNACMLNSASSSIAPNKSDTVKWTVNLTLNSNNGPFRKNVTVNAKAADGTNVSDVSNDGMNPAPAGEDPTVLNFNNLASDLIGISKELVSIEPFGTNLYDVVFKFNVKNYGIIDFTGVQVQDNLAQTFGPSVIIDSVKVFDITPGFTLNAGYTGKGLLIDLLDDSKSTLPVKTTRSLSLLVRIDLSQSDTTVFENMALAVGYQNGSSTDDLSTTGNNPDPEADGTPENNSIPTLIDFGTVVEAKLKTPIGIAKSVSDTVAIVDGSYQITYSIIVKNYGDTILNNVQLVDSLSSVFGDSTDFAMIGRPVMVSKGLLRLNPDFDGITELNILDSDSSTLAVGATDTITFKVKVRNNSSKVVTYNNTIYGNANVGSKSVTDKSTAGLNPDPDGDNNPGNNSIPTPITLKSGKVKNPTNVAVSIPGGISPNGDGINDNLVIEGITVSDELEFKVFNRWGELVFETKNYKLLYPGATDGWEGYASSGIRFNKTLTKLPDGTYFFSAHSKNQAMFNGKPYYNYLTIAGGTKN